MSRSYTISLCSLGCSRPTVSDFLNYTHFYHDVGYFEFFYFLNTTLLNKHTKPVCRRPHSTLHTQNPCRSGGVISCSGRATATQLSRTLVDPRHKLCLQNILPCSQALTRRTARHTTIHPTFLSRRHCRLLPVSHQLGCRLLSIGACSLRHWWCACFSSLGSRARLGLHACWSLLVVCIRYTSSVGSPPLVSSFLIGISSLLIVYFVAQTLDFTLSLRP